MATYTYKDLKTKVINAGGLDNSYSADNLDTEKVFPIQFTAETTMDLGEFQDAVMALRFEEETDQTFGLSGGDVEELGNLDVQLLTGIDNAGKNVYAPKAGGSLFLNSDRVVINAKDDFAIIAGKLGVAIASPEKVNIDSGESITLFGHSSVFLGLPNRGESYDEKTTIDLPAPSTVGDPTPDEPYEPMVLGIKLLNLMEDLIVTIENAEIAGPVGNGVFQPSTLAEFELLKLRLPEIISNYAYVDGLSHEIIDKDALSDMKKARDEAIDYVAPRSIKGITKGEFKEPPKDDDTPQNPVTSPTAQLPGYYETPQVDLYGDSNTL
jgi:hypothetical protein